MSEDTQPLDSDDELASRARLQLDHSPEARMLAALLRQLRIRPHPWWSPANLRRSWPTATRFEWLAGRPDVRGRLTHELTGLAPAAARNLERSLQVEIIERVVEAGEVSAERWELAYHPEELALHAPPALLWQEFRSRFPWDAPRVEDLELLGWFIQDLMAPKAPHGPVLTPTYVRSAIDLLVWQEHLPIEVRVQVDGRRLQRELEHKNFTCADELAVVKVERIVQFIPTRHLRSILDAVERVFPVLTDLSEEPLADLDPAELEPMEGAADVEH
jgi:hypothetical protein